MIDASCHEPEAADAVFVEIIPRQNWRRVMAETADDFGFLRTAGERNEIHYEGVSQQIVVPAGAIESLHVETIQPGEAMVPYPIHLVVLKAWVGDVLVELPFNSLSATYHKANAETARLGAHDLFQRLHAVRQSARLDSVDDAGRV